MSILSLFKVFSLVYAFVIFNISPSAIFSRISVWSFQKVTLVIPVSSPARIDWTEPSVPLEEVKSILSYFFKTLTIKLTGTFASVIDSIFWRLVSFFVYLELLI